MRKLCPRCKKPVEPSRTQLERFGLPEGASLQLYEAAGCDHCNGLGYKGRVGAFELLVFDEPLREMIVRREGAEAVRTYALENLNMVTVQRDALRKAAKGITSFQEVARVAG